MSYTVGFKHGGTCYYGNSFETACVKVSELRANVIAGSPIKPSLVVERFPWGRRTAEALLALSLDYALADLDHPDTPTSEILAAAQAKVDEAASFARENAALARERERNEAGERIAAAQRATLQGFKLGDAVRITSGPFVGRKGVIESAGSLNRSIIVVTRRHHRELRCTVIAEELGLIEPAPQDVIQGDVDDARWIGAPTEAPDSRNPLELTAEEKQINQLAGELDRARGQLARERRESEKKDKRLNALEANLLAILRGDPLPDLEV
jgi:hypothetical protein